MRIDCLELVGYKRLMLSNIQKFIYKPESAYQLILGTNGSGKSSILQELSPLPARSADFVKGGYKTIHLTHKDSVFELSSTFKSGNKHSFVKDGVELNDGGTGRVQESLVEREFGLTFELHDLLIGQSLFTDLAPLKRRDWCTKLSTADYAFALKFYQKLKVNARDSQGALKHVKKRLLDETQALQKLEEDAGIEATVQTLHEELSTLLYARIPNAPEYQPTRARLEGLLDRVTTLSKAVLTQTGRLPSETTHRSQKDVEEALQGLSQSIQTANDRLTHFTSEYTELEEIIRSIAPKDGESVEDLEGTILRLEDELAGMGDRFTLFSGFTDPKGVLRDSQEVIDQVIDLFKQLPDNHDRRYSRQTFEEGKEKLRKANFTLDKAKVKQAQIESRIEVLETAKATECPSCGYTWKEGYSESELAQQHHWLKQCAQAEVDSSKDVASLKAFLEDTENYVALYNRFRGFVNNYPRLKVLWDYLLEKRYVTDSPATHIDVFYTWLKDVELAAKRFAYTEQLEKLKDLAARQAKLGGQHFHVRLLKLHQSIEETTGELESLKRSYKQTRAHSEGLVKLQTTISELEGLVEEADALVGACVDGLANQVLDHEIAQKQSELGSAQHRLNERSALEGVVKDLGASHSALQEDSDALQLLVKAMSPEEGLIADQLRNSIGCLVAQLNSIIASIWTYDMTVLPCGVDSGDLDYKFPLQVRSDANQVPDIKYGSKAQKEVVNFAFQLTAMLYLGLEDFPLCLDELGAGFDEEHRQNLIGFIKHLMDSQRHSQLFMISHYVDSSMAFPGAQYLVLDGSNIAVPSEHNQHAILA